MKTANFTVQFWGLFILGLPMETVSGVQLGFTTNMLSACTWNL